MKKRNKIGKIIGLVFLTLIVIGISYIGTYYIDKYQRSGNVDISVTYDDTLTYVIPSINKMDQETALKEWPYMFTIESKGNKKGLYQIIIEDIETSTIKRDNLDYLLVLNDINVKEGHLMDIKNNILYQGEINKNTKERYKLYIWVNNDIEIENQVYEYKVTLNAIKEGGPGF